MAQKTEADGSLPLSPSQEPKLLARVGMVDEVYTQNRGITPDEGPARTKTIGQYQKQGQQQRAEWWFLCRTRAQRQLLLNEYRKQITQE